MSNKAFFNSFFKQNKIWQQIQNNPVAHQYWFPHKIPLFAAYHVLNRGTPARTDIDYNHRIRYHGPANPRIRTRIRRYDVKDYLPNFPSTIKTKKQAWDYTHDRHLSDFPAIGAHLPSHRAHGLTLAQRQERSLENVQAMLGAGNFVLEDFRYKTDDDYWLPHYEGDFFGLAEKSARKTPQYYNRHQKFLGYKPFMTNKQKAALVWLDANFS